MSVSRLRILVVEDLKQWREPIGRLFSEHLVDLAGNFDEAAKRVAPGGIPYDVAIVDLNLITTEEDVRGDMLGGEILLRLQRYYPATLRIALTGSPPRGALIKNLVRKYQVYDFFMKGNMDLADLRDLVLDSPAAKAAAVATTPVAPEVQQAKAEQLQRLRQWAQPRRAELRQAIEDLQNKRRFAGRAPQKGPSAEEALKSTLADLGTERDALDRECARTEEMLAQATTLADVALVAEGIGLLTGGP